MDRARNQQSQPCLLLARAAFAAGRLSRLYCCWSTLGLSSAADLSTLAKVRSVPGPEQHFSANLRNHLSSALVDCGSLREPDNFGVSLAPTSQVSLYLPLCVGISTSCDQPSASLSTVDPKTVPQFPGCDWPSPCEHSVMLLATSGQQQTGYHRVQMT